MISLDHQHTGVAAICYLRYGLAYVNRNQTLLRAWFNVRNIGGSRGVHASPPRVQLLSFRHTKCSKRNRLGSQRPPPTWSTHPYGKSWIRLCINHTQVVDWLRFTYAKPQPGQCIYWERILTYVYSGGKVNQLNHCINKKLSKTCWKHKVPYFLRTFMILVKTQDGCL